MYKSLSSCYVLLLWNAIQCFGNMSHLKGVVFGILLCLKIFVSSSYKLRISNKTKSNLNSLPLKAWIILTMKCFQSLICSTHLTIGHSWMPQWCRMAGSSVQGRFFHSGELRMCDQWHLLLFFIVIFCLVVQSGGYLIFNRSVCDSVERITFDYIQF